jgi:hypothetical protein
VAKRSRRLTRLFRSVGAESARDAAARLGVSVSTVYRWGREGVPERRRLQLADLEVSNRRPGIPGRPRKPPRPPRPARPTAGPRKPPKRAPKKPTARPTTGKGKKPPKRAPKKPARPTPAPPPPPPPPPPKPPKKPPRKPRKPPEPPPRKGASFGLAILETLGLDPLAELAAQTFAGQPVTNVQLTEEGWITGEDVDGRPMRGIAIIATEETDTDRDPVTFRWIDRAKLPEEMDPEEGWQFEEGYESLRAPQYVTVGVFA